MIPPSEVPATESVNTMLNFEIPVMSCGHCVRAITEAVHAADANAKVETDLATHQVKVETTAPRAAVVAQLVEAGYAPA
jgi:copper chaperone